MAEIRSSVVHGLVPSIAQRSARPRIHSVAFVLAVVDLISSGNISFAGTRHEGFITDFVTAKEFSESKAQVMAEKTL